MDPNTTILLIDGKPDAIAGLQRSYPDFADEVLAMVDFGRTIRFGDPEVSVELAATYRRLRTGHYGLAGSGPTPLPGTPVRVLVHGGEIRTEVVGRVVWSEPGKAWISTIGATSAPTRIRIVRIDQCRPSTERR